MFLSTVDFHIGDAVDHLQIRNDFFIGDLPDLIEASLSSGLERDELIGQLIGIGFLNNGIKFLAHL